MIATTRATTPCSRAVVVRSCHLDSFEFVSFAYSVASSMSVASPALKPILRDWRRIGAPVEATHGVVRRDREGGGGNARAGDGDANGAVGVGGFAEGEAVVVAAPRARARRLSVAARMSLTSFLETS